MCRSRASVPKGGREGSPERQQLNGACLLRVWLLGVCWGGAPTHCRNAGRTQRATRQTHAPAAAREPSRERRAYLGRACATERSGPCRWIMDTAQLRRARGCRAVGASCARAARVGGSHRRGIGSHLNTHALFKTFSPRLTTPTRRARGRRGRGPRRARARARRSRGDRGAQGTNPDHARTSEVGIVGTRSRTAGTGRTVYREASRYGGRSRTPTRRERDPRDAARDVVSYRRPGASPSALAGCPPAPRPTSMPRLSPPQTRCLFSVPHARCAARSCEILRPAPGVASPPPPASPPRRHSPWL